MHYIDIVSQPPAKAKPGGLPYCYRSQWHCTVAYDEPTTLTLSQHKSVSAQVRS
jgi:hypothetical protein